MAYNDREYYQLTQSIQKALIGYEMPLKVKHARAAIISTFNHQGAKVFWSIAIKQPLMDNQITAWKFCHLLHKVLREGHNLCASDSMIQKKWLIDFGKIWGHLADGYGLCILHYTKLLVTKIKFHNRNPRFPGNLQMTREEIEAIGAGDLNYVFQLTTEIFDYLDQIIGLQATINNSLNSMRINSMTSAGQCRIAALIPCIEDSNHLYDISVRFMFKLYANVPEDILTGHIDRFSTIYHQLVKFYSQSKEFQFFQNLIAVPELPKKMPDFTSVSGIREYHTPVCVIPDEEPEPEPEDIFEKEPEPSYSIKEDQLIDMSFDKSNGAMALPVEEKPYQLNEHFEELIRERDDLVTRLQSEMSSMRGYITKTQSETTHQQIQLQNQITSLNQQFQKRNEEYNQLKVEKDKLENAVKSAEILEKRLAEEDEKSKSNDEKFNKLKAMYTQIRDEHVKLLRQHQETSKKLTETSKSFEEVEQSKKMIESQLQVIEIEKSKTQEQLQQNAQHKEMEKEELLQQIEQIKEECQSFKQQYEELDTTMNNTISELNTNINTLKSDMDELKENNKILEDEKQKLQDENNSLSKIKADLEQQYQQTLIVIEDKHTENVALQQQHGEDNTTKANHIQQLNVNIDLLNKQLDKMRSNATQLEDEKLELLKKTSNFEKSINELEMKFHQTESILMEQKTQNEEHVEKYKNLTDQKQEVEHALDGVKNKLEELQNLHTELQNQFDDLQTEKLKQEDDSKTQSEEEVQKSIVMQRELNEQIESITLAKEDLHTQKEECLIEINDLKTQLTEKIDECVKLQDNLEATVSQKDTEISELQSKLEEAEQKYKVLNANMERLMCEKSELESDIQDLLGQQEELESRNSEYQTKLAELEEHLRVTKIQNTASVRALLEACIKSSEYIASKPLTDSDLSSAIGTPTYFLMVAEELKDVLIKLDIVHKKYLEDSSNVEGLARKVIVGGHLLATVHVQGLLICNSSPDIERGEQSAEHLTEWCKKSQILFGSLLSENNKVESNITDVQSKLDEIIKIIGDLTKKSDSSEQLSDLIEAELLSMDKSIDEAANKIEQMLSQSRAQDSGIKLEVNEKILDACTTLMKAIRLLVQKSRVLQAEIVSHGKGTASVKEFYKRNHQWTEGMISAAKNVAQGANFLVTAANKAVSGESKHQLDLVVAAQEIAASTAQLVVASRVKAPRGSQNLAALSDVSKKVTQATGAVVATAKDSSQRLEESQDLDLSSLTVHQAKTLEMEMQVKLLELEQSVQTERLRIAAFRRKNYSAVE